MAIDTASPRLRENASRLSAAHRLSVLAGLVVPFLGVPALAWLLTHHALSLLQIILMVACSIGLYLYSGFGITAGYHRLFTHNSYQVPVWLRRALAIAGSSALQGPIINWVADHRKHHKYSDEVGDPHSPHLHAGGWWGKVLGFFHAHMGWLFTNAGAPAPKELVEDPFMVKISQRGSYLLIALMSLFGLPALLGFLITGDGAGALYGIVWIGLVRAFFLLQFTFAINSVCHVFGRRTFVTEDQSRDVWWLKWFTLGESNHNGHHAFPFSFRHGLGGGIDPSALLILLWEKLGLAYNLRRVAPERVALKLRATT